MLYKKEPNIGSEMKYFQENSAEEESEDNELDEVRKRQNLIFSSCSITSIYL